MNDSTGDNDDDNICPVCFGPMDETDYRLFPCPCHFQICMWCLNRLLSENERCPNCREPYDKSRFQVVEKKEDSTSSEDSSDDENGHHSHYNRNKEDKSNSVYNEKNLDTEEGRLANTRIVQRNLVYIVGMPAEEASDEVFYSPNMFGKYGTIQKLVICNSSILSCGKPTVGVYITYTDDASALNCIRAIDGYWYKGYLLKASFGTTKYCNSFIRGIKCTNKECLYLHVKAASEDCFLRDEMNVTDHDFYERTHPGYGSFWNERSKKYEYYRNSMLRSGKELPNDEGNAKELLDYVKQIHLIRFGLSDEEYELTKTIQTDDIPEFNEGDIAFAADINGLPLTYVPEPSTNKTHTDCGIAVDLNQLFGNNSNSNGLFLPTGVDTSETSLIQDLMYNTGNNFYPDYSQFSQPYTGDSFMHSFWNEDRQNSYN